MRALRVLRKHGVRRRVARTLGAVAARWAPCRYSLSHAPGAHASLADRDTKGCDPKETSSCRDTKKCVATPTGPSLERHQFLIATPKGQPMSRHHESCRNTKLHVPYRDTKKCVATQPQLPSSFRVATPKAMSRHPNGCLRRDIKIMSRPRPSLVPASTMS